MAKTTTISPWRVLLPIGLGTSLSLIGDTSLYAVLPTNVAAAGVSVASVGILLSANRFIRLLLNGPAGFLYDRLPRRTLFVPALFIGALSTAIYGLTSGFWPLLGGRLLWGLAWSGIWVGGNTIIMDISHQGNRGRWVGIYQTSFFLGASGGAMIGGFLTDWLGYHQAMGIKASLTLLGALVALLFLPETRNLRSSHEVELAEAAEPQVAVNGSNATHWPELASAIGLLGVYRLVVAGVLLPTLGLFLLQQLGNSIEIGTLTIGVASLTGLAFGLNGIISMITIPIIGSVSDRMKNRWQAAAGGLVPGVIGFGLIALGSPLSLLVGVTLTAITGSSSQGLSTTLVGDLSSNRQRGQRLGILFTVGDLTSAIGPPLAYGVLPILGLTNVYLLSAGVFAMMFLLALRWALRPRRQAVLETIENE